MSADVVLRGVRPMAAGGPVDVLVRAGSSSVAPGIVPPAGTASTDGRPLLPPVDAHMPRQDVRGLPWRAEAGALRASAREWRLTAPALYPQTWKPSGWCAGRWWTSTSAAT
jgi:hypothetical protein